MPERWLTPGAITAVGGSRDRRRRRSRRGAAGDSRSARRRTLPRRKRNASLEAARAFRLKRWIADEIAGEEAVEVEEGRLRDALGIGAGQREAATDLGQCRGAERGRVLEAVEEVAADGDVADEACRFAAPLGGKRLVLAGSVLVGEAAVDRVAGMEGLALGFGGEDQSWAMAPVDEAALDLRVERSAGAAGAVDARRRRESCGWTSRAAMRRLRPLQAIRILRARPRPARPARRLRLLSSVSA